MAYKNKKDAAAQKRRYRARNKERINKQKKDYYKRKKDIIWERIKKRRAERQIWYHDYKLTLKCSRCPENHPTCLDFHHQENKKFTISNELSRGKSLKTLQSEIAKCIVLCANCHRKEHSAVRKCAPH